MVLSRKAVSATLALGLAGALAGALVGAASAAPLAPADGDQVCMTYYDQQGSGGSTPATTGKACRGSDGQWRPADSSPSTWPKFHGVYPVNSAVVARHPYIHCRRNP
jgi:hypothetical protein